jgi:hypothetical protein
MTQNKGGLIGVEAFNFMIHRGSLKIDLNKESIIVAGDSGFGKSSLSRLILAHLGQVPYPKNPLNDEEQAGWTKTVHEDANGKLYTVKRSFTRQEDGSVSIGKFQARGPDGRNKSLLEIMETSFNGVFTHARFDYNTYFNKTVSDIDRYKVFVKGIGGEAIDKNKDDITQLEGERAAIGNSRDIQKALWENVSYSEETMEADIEYYAQERTEAEATEAKNEHLKKLVDTSELTAKLNKHKGASDVINSERVKLSSIAGEIDEIQKQIAELQSKLDKKKLALKQSEDFIKEQDKKTLTIKQVDALQSKVEKAEEQNINIRKRADEIFSEKLNEIVEFKTKKAEFFNGVEAFDEWTKLNDEWNDLDEKIKAKRKDSDDILRSLLPLKELSIGEDAKGNNIVLYKGRPFSADYLSTGEQVQITAQIQMALNPNGGNFIVIPNAQNLGSKLKEVQESCKKFNVQYLLEVTRPYEEFTVELVDHGPVNDL